jgi:hypothetical protein
VHEFSLKVLQTWDLRPFPVVQDASSIDKELGTVFEHDVSFEITYSTSPQTICIIPFDMLQTVSQLDVLGDEVVFALYRFQVVPNLRRI